MDTAVNTRSKYGKQIMKTTKKVLILLKQLAKKKYLIKVQ